MRKLAFQILNRLKRWQRDRRLLDARSVDLVTRGYKVLLPENTSGAVYFEAGIDRGPGFKATIAEADSFFEALQSVNETESRELNLGDSRVYLRKDSEYVVMTFRIPLARVRFHQGDLTRACDKYKSLRQKYSSDGVFRYGE